MILHSTVQDAQMILLLHSCQNQRLLTRRLVWIVRRRIIERRTARAKEEAKRTKSIIEREKKESSRVKGERMWMKQRPHQELQQIKAMPLLLQLISVRWPLHLFLLMLNSLIQMHPIILSQNLKNMLPSPLLLLSLSIQLIDNFSMQLVREIYLLLLQMAKGQLPSPLRIFCLSLLCQLLSYLSVRWFRVASLLISRRMAAIYCLLLIPSSW